MYYKSYTESKNSIVQPKIYWY